MEKKIKYTGKLTSSEFKKLEESHGKIDTIEVPLNDDFTEFAVGYLKKIDRQLMGAALSIEDSIASKEMLLNAIWVAGDDRIKTVDEYFYSACTVMGKLLEFRKAVLKKN